MAKNFFKDLFGKKDKADKASSESAQAVEESAETQPEPTLSQSSEPEPSPTPILDVEQTAALALPSDNEQDNSINNTPHQGPEAPLQREHMLPPDADGQALSGPATVEGEASVQEPTPQQERLPSVELEEDDASDQKQGWFSKLRQGLTRTSNKLSDGVTSIFTKRKLDEDTLEEFEELLITADLGVAAAGRVTQRLAKDRFDKEVTDQDVKQALAEIVAETLEPLEEPLAIDRDKRPHVILMTGVNGAGKTTTIGKLAAQFQSEGLKVMLAAGDTFRAAAIDQLQVWGDRTGAPVITKDVGADAAGLAFDAVRAAQEQGVDVLLIDTAGRLQNRTELMDELAKIVRVIRKLDETAPHNTLLVLDATVGQNAISQAQAFKDIAEISGLVMTKLDGTARGGVLVALADKFELPIHYIGVGEGVADLQPFKAAEFAKALAGVQQ